VKHRKNPSYGRIRTWPNAVSALRLALALAAAVLFLAFGLILAPILLSVVASLLDFLDGWLARRMRQITRLGEHLDPLADKVLVTVVFGALAWFLRELWVSVAVSLLLLREWGITWLREFVQRRQQLTLPAGRMGKWKMLSQSLFGNLFLFWMSRAPDARPGEGTFLPTLGLALGLILVLSYASAIRYLGRLSS
jgi:CDP-diacylglycerol--glycerol-3-phosphate 3-phosphatidyltransferase